MDAPYDGDTVENTTELRLNFDKIKKIGNQDVIPVAVQHADTNEVLLIAYTNEFAMEESIKRRKACFWSTSRKKLWLKGEESGNTFTLVSIYINCEQNSLVYKVLPDKDNICHTSIGGVANNCFYRRLDMDARQLVFNNYSSTD